MQASKLFVRVVPADRDRGYMLLAGYDAKITQRTCLTYSTLGEPTRASLTAAIDRIRSGTNAAEVQDVTAPALQKKLAKLFGEVAAPPPKPVTFTSLGVGKYLPDADEAPF